MPVCVASGDQSGASLARRPSLTRLACALGAVAIIGTGCATSGGSSRGPDVDLVGTWVAVLPPPGPNAGPHTVTVEFQPDGHWVGTDGCNQMGGSYSVNGDHLDASADTNFVGGECVGPNVVWMDVLPQVDQVETRGSSRLLLDGSGKTLVTIQPLSG